MYFRVPSVMFCSFVFCYIWLYWLGEVNVLKLFIIIFEIPLYLKFFHYLELPAERYVNDYKLAVYCFGAGCIIESFVEPVYLYSQAFLYMIWRVS